MSPANPPSVAPKPSAMQRASHQRFNAIHVAVALFFLVLAALMALQITGMPTEVGYSGVSARMVPTFVGAGLLIVGLLLLYQALTGGFRDLSHEGDGVAPNVKAVLWILAGLVIFMLGAKPLGFALAATALFVCAAKGFGSTRWKTDLLWGFAVSMGAFVFFNTILGVDLPAGVFKLFF